MSNRDFRLVNKQNLLTCVSRPEPGDAAWRAARSVEVEHPRPCAFHCALFQCFRSLPVALEPGESLHLLYQQAHLVFSSSFPYQDLLI